MKRIFLLLLILPALLSCSPSVSIDEYNNLLEQLNSLQSKYDALGKHHSELQDSKKQIDNELLRLELKTEESKGEIEGLKAEIEKSKDETEDLKTQLDLYKQTYGEVYFGVDPPYTSGNKDIKLNRNPVAEDITWEQLKSFLKKDKTDQTFYVNGKYECGNYANDIYNNAHRSNIRCAFVTIHYKNRIYPHSINAFKTLDNGLVFIDSTGDEEYKKQEWEIEGYRFVDGELVKIEYERPPPPIYDSIVKPVIGEWMPVPEFVFPNSNWEMYKVSAGIVSNIELYW